MFFKTVLLFLSVLIFQSGFAFAGMKEDALKVLPGKDIIVTGHPDYAPIIWKTDSKLQGVAVELVEMAFAELGVKVKTFNASTWGRAQEEVKEGRADMLLPPYTNEERILVYEYYKTPILMDETAVFVKKGSKVKFKKFEDLAKYSGVAIIDDSFGNQFDKLMKTTLKIERLATTEQCFDFLMSDRANYMVAGLNSGLAVAAKLGFENKVEILPKRIITTGMYAPISKKSPWNKPQIHKFINKRIESYAKRGLVKKLEKKYWAIFKESHKPTLK